MTDTTTLAGLEKRKNELREKHLKILREKYRKTGNGIFLIMMEQWGEGCDYIAGQDEGEGPKQ